MFSHFYSDPHFGHTNIIKHADRPYSDTEEMDMQLIHNYNSVVKKDDHVLFCGDCTFRFKEFGKIMDKLNGRKSLIAGNHDKSKAHMARLPFEFVTDTLHMNILGQDVIVSHYPPINARVEALYLRQRMKYVGREHDARYADKRIDIAGRDIVIIHGHTHEKVKAPPGQRRVHVGVDAWDYKPAPVDEVAKLFPIARGEHV